MKTDSLRTHELQAMLHDDYIRPGHPSSGLFVAEIESPCGKRRADALWVPLTMGGGRKLIGHEIKVSRSDLLVELADPAKCDPWLQFCDRWWLVISDPAMIHGLVIPDAWGVMAPPSGRLKRSMTILKPAPELYPRDKAAGMHRVLSWLYFNQQHRLGQAERDRDYARKERDRGQEQLRERMNTQLGMSSAHAKRVSEIVQAVDLRLRSQEMPWWAQSATNEQIAEGIADLVVAQAMALQVRRSVEGLVNETEDRFGAVREAREIFNKGMKAVLREHEEAIAS